MIFSQKVVFVLLLSAVVVVMAAPSGTCNPHPIPAIHIRAKSNYDYGYQIGATFSGIIQGFIRNNTQVQKLLSYINTIEGKKIFDTFVYAQNTSLPLYVDEISGYADGSGVDFRTLMVINMSPEFGLIMHSKAGTFAYGELPDIVEDCSDVLLKIKNPNGDGYIMQHAHNEDGYLAGNAFSYNAYGMGISTNALPPSDVIVGGIVRYFINRYVIESKTIDDVWHRLNKFTCACGFNTNAGSIYEQRLITVEKWHDLTNILELKGSESCPTALGVGYYEHYNAYLRMNVSQFRSESSEHRYKRGVEIGPLCNSIDILTVEGDTADPQYPIYRTQTPPDDIATLATALYDYNKRKVTVYSANPKLCDPVMVLDMMDI